MDTQAIRNKILDLALRGKLTEQLPEDGTADELYRHIITENKSRKNGKSAQQYPIEEEMIPCSIPDNWIWTKVGNLITLISGTDFKPEDYNDAGNGLPYMTGASNIDDDHLIINRWTTAPRNISYKGDLLLVCKGSGFGKLALNNVPEAHIARQFMAIRPFDGLNVKYIKAVMENSFNTIKEAGKGLIPGVDRETVLNLYLPLPPLAEQQRIVEKVESLFSILYTIDTLQSQYQDNLATLKSKIIDAAIQGKLTEQFPEDGTAEELYQQIQQEKLALEKAGKIKKSKPLPPISEEEKPFDIPENWKWVRIGGIANSIYAGGDKPEDFSKVKDNAHLIPVVGNGVDNEGILGYTGKSTAKAYTITVAGRGTIGFSVFRQYEYCPIVRLIVIEQNANIDPRYIQYVLQALPESGVGSSIPQLTVPMLTPKVIPLPPLAEQKRIVAKLEELLPLCEG